MHAVLLWMTVANLHCKFSFWCVAKFLSGGGFATDPYEERTTLSDSLVGWEEYTLQLLPVLPPLDDCLVLGGAPSLQPLARAECDNIFLRTYVALVNATAITGTSFYICLLHFVINENNICWRKAQLSIWSGRGDFNTMLRGPRRKKFVHQSDFYPVNHCFGCSSRIDYINGHFEEDFALTECL